MASESFAVSVRSEGGRAVLDLYGEINGLAGDVLNEAFSRATAEGGQAVVLNFGAVNYINSIGIAVIVELLARARQAHREMIVYGLDDHYKEIFKITRLSDFMRIHEDEKAALGSY